MSLKNLFNDWYVRDTSKKVKAVLNAKAQRGERIGRAPYGWNRACHGRGNRTSGQANLHGLCQWPGSFADCPQAPRSANPHAECYRSTASRTVCHGGICEIPLQPVGANSRANPRQPGLYGRSSVHEASKAIGQKPCSASGKTSAGRRKWASWTSSPG